MPDARNGGRTLDRPGKPPKVSQIPPRRLNGLPMAMAADLRYRWLIAHLNVVFNRVWTSPGRETAWPETAFQEITMPQC